MSDRVMTDKTARKQKGHLFQKGHSGNPEGRPKGVGKAGKLRALLEPNAPALVEKAKDMALEGDTTALRLCLERLVPPIKSEDTPVYIEGLKGDMSLSEQAQMVISTLADGSITPGEASTMMQAISSLGRIREVEDLEARIAALEAQQ